MTTRRWYDDAWDILELMTTDTYDTEFRIYALKVLSKHSDRKIIKFLDSRRITFNFTDGTFKSKDITSGICIFGLK